jgi:hypothetical protein
VIFLPLVWPIHGIGWSAKANANTFLFVKFGGNKVGIFDVFPFPTFPPQCGPTRIFVVFPAHSGCPNVRPIDFPTVQHVVLPKRPRKVFPHSANGLRNGTYSVKSRRIVNLRVFLFMVRRNSERVQSISVALLAAYLKF